MKNNLAERLEFAADFHKKTGRHENAELFAEAAAAIRELEAERANLREALEGIHEITSKPFQSDNASIRQWVEVHARKTLNALADKGDG